MCSLLDIIILFARITGKKKKKHNVKAPTILFLYTQMSLEMYYSFFHFLIRMDLSGGDDVVNLWANLLLLLGMGKAIMLHTIF